ncbi:MAG: aspartate carbamoyltransferase [Endozoicomonadaceae bacterium]|nr:aspartate carbamoyltransferase [Endozoicomonadaceae bacterium]
MDNKTNNALYQQHIISISDMSREMLEFIIMTIEKIKRQKICSLLSGKIIGSCFFEPSTRTKLSFEVAVRKLGGTTIGFDNGVNTSLKKGETLADSIKIISSYTDALIIRHPKEGAARLAAQFSSVPVINGGDGANQHPTQTLLDLFTIYECHGRLDNLTVALAGDLKYGRTVHSLVQALSLFNTRFIFISPEELAMPEYLLSLLDQRNICYEQVYSIESILHETDILYMTRIQKERFDETEYKYIAARYILDKAMLTKAKPSLRVLHPLPRVDEIAPDVDETPFACYFQQAENGVYARMSLLALVLNKIV